MSSTSATSTPVPTDTDYETLLANLQRRVDALQGPLSTIVRVAMAGSTVEYQIDRWD